MHHVFVMHISSQRFGHSFSCIFFSLKLPPLQKELGCVVFKIFGIRNKIRISQS